LGFGLRHLAWRAERAEGNRECYEDSGGKKRRLDRTIPETPQDLNERRKAGEIEAFPRNGRFVCLWLKKKAKNSQKLDHQQVGAEEGSSIIFGEVHTLGENRVSEAAKSVFLKIDVRQRSQISM